MSAGREISGSSRPFVLANMAMTADGKIATANRAISSFGSALDRAHLFELRATVDAVMVGARTADATAIQLGPGPARFRRQRQANGLAEYNLRVLVSGSGSISPDAEIFKHRFSPIIVLTTARASATRLRRLRRLADEVKVLRGHRINFRTALRWLRRDCGVKRLLCEGGGELNSALFRQGVVDELHLTICPIIFGGRAAPTIAQGAGVSRLARAYGFRVQSWRPVNGELFLVLRASDPR